MQLLYKSSTQLLSYFTKTKRKKKRKKKERKKERKKEKPELTQSSHDFGQ
jgi:hypothetical protein